MITHSLRNWTQFLGFVLDELKHRPIRFPADAVTKRTGKAGVIFDRMEKHSATVYKDGYIPIALYLSYLSDWDPPGFFFNVELFDLTGGAPTTMAGPLFFTEDATQFAHP